MVCAYLHGIIILDHPIVQLRSNRRKIQLLRNFRLTAYGRGIKRQLGVCKDAVGVFHYSYARIPSIRNLGSSIADSTIIFKLSKKLSIFKLLLQRNQFYKIVQLSRFFGIIESAPPAHADNRCIKDTGAHKNYFTFEK